jgi:hypothetical protein
MIGPSTFVMSYEHESVNGQAANGTSDALPKVLLSGLTDRSPR